MWEVYIKPTLKEQEEIEPATNRPAVKDEPMTLERKIAETQGMAMLLGQDPLEVAKAVKASWPLKPGDIERLRDRLNARHKAGKGE